MNPLFQIIIDETIKHQQKNKGLSSKEFRKKRREAKVEFIHITRDSFFIILGVLSAGFGLNGFLLPNSFIDGGAMGISLLLQVFKHQPTKRICHIL